MAQSAKSRFVVFVMGPTCSGKTTLIDALQDENPDVFDSIRVGQEFRKRYSAKRFAGKAALPDTENEALEIFGGAFIKWLAGNKRICLVDGVPRLPSSVVLYANLCRDMKIKPVFIYLNCTDEARIARLEERESGAEKAQSRKLALERCTNDKIMNHDTLFALQALGKKIHMVDTSSWSNREHAIIEYSRIMASYLA